MSPILEEHIRILKNSNPFFARITGVFILLFALTLISWPYATIREEIITQSAPPGFGILLFGTFFATLYISSLFISEFYLKEDSLRVSDWFKKTDLSTGKILFSFISLQIFQTIFACFLPYQFLLIQGFTRGIDIYMHLEICSGLFVYFLAFRSLAECIKLLFKGNPFIALAVYWIASLSCALLPMQSFPVLSPLSAILQNKGPFLLSRGGFIAVGLFFLSTFVFSAIGRLKKYRKKNVRKT